MTETIVICLTAILCSILLAGGINRAAFYLSRAIEKRDVFDFIVEIMAKTKEEKKSKSNVISIRRDDHE